MRVVLISEICKERPNKAALGGYNVAISRGASPAQASNAAENVNKTVTDSSFKSKTSYGLQPNGNFVASNSKQFGTRVDAMAGQKNPSAVILKGRDGITDTRVEKAGTIYVVTKYDANGKQRRIDKIKKKEFEYNYRHHI